jgi:hypothetical protein
VLSRRHGAAAGLAMAVLWAPIALVITELPNLSSPGEIDSFYAEHGQTMRFVLASVSLGFVPLLFFLGALVEELHDWNTGWLWTALASALIFMTALAVALGLEAAAVLLFEEASLQTIWALHSAAFILAAPAAGAGTTFFIAVAVLALRAKAWSPGIGWLAIVGAAINLGAVAGFFSLSGAANSGNGLLGGLAGPLGIWLLWIVAVSVSWLTGAAAPPGSRPAVDSDRAGPRLRRRSGPGDPE